jgi:molybdate transport system regulatory protein
MEMPSVDKKPVLRLHIWFEAQGGVFFGHGRAQLLDYIDQYGSLKKAAEMMGMSYRGAWGKIKRTEEILGFKLIDKTSNKGGFILTDSGKQCMELFRIWLRDVERYALGRAAELFPWESVAHNNLIVVDNKPQ